jgi:ribosomal protein S18 acetylase RimI-like enzyme
MLAATHQLSQPSLNALEALLNACQTADNAVVPVYPHLLACYRPGPASLLYYKDKQLVGFLALFHFYPKMAEVALFIHPTYRKRGLAQTLWATMCQNIQSHGLLLEHLIVSTPKGINQPWFNQHAFFFESTEYEMTRTPYVANHPHAITYSIEQASLHHINTLHHIDSTCFNPNRAEPIQRLKKLLATPNIKIFLMLHHKQIIGQVHLIYKKNQIWLTDFAIMPHMQHQGFGQALLEFCLKNAHEAHQKKICLTVAAKNQVAFHLYQNLGFQIYNAIDYYKRGFSLDRF